MTKTKHPVTPAIRQLRMHHATWQGYLYQYEEHGGTHLCATALNVDEHITIKTLIMEDEHQSPLIILMHGDCEVSTQKLARTLSCRSITPCSPDTANKHSGYLVGGTSPFGTRHPMPVYMESSIADLHTLYINGGKRGYILQMEPKIIINILKPTLINVAVSPKTS